MYFCHDDSYKGDAGHNWGPGMVRDFTTFQQATMATWDSVGDREPGTHPMNVVTHNVTPTSTITQVNGLLPLEDRWLEIPTGDAPVIPAPRW